MLAATRGAAFAAVRVLDVGERVRKPSCTIEVGGRHFEITDHHSGRKASGRAWSVAERTIRNDLPTTGWVDVPADLDALDEEALAFADFVGDLSEKLLGGRDPVASIVDVVMGKASLMVGSPEKFESFKEKGRRALRDEYVRKISAL